MKSLFVLTITLALVTLSRAEDPAVPYEKLNWKEPSKELLLQKYCPIDSSADAMVVQKEMEFIFVAGDLNVISRKRIKIYTDRGLSYAQFKEYYDNGIDITSIDACSYDSSGLKTELDQKDVHIEIILKSEKGGFKWASKSFAVPNVTAGSVIDVIIRSVYLRSITPPVFRFHEDIPVGIARFIMNPKSSQYYSYRYSYVITNRELIQPRTYTHDDDFICEAQNIPAIENELYTLPKRNLVTDLWINLKGFIYLGVEIDFASNWKVLLEGDCKSFKTAFDSSKKAHKLADSLMAVTNDPIDRINLAYNIVRDRWENVPLFGVSGAPTEINELMKQKSLDPEEKATVLWAVLKYMGIESEVVWVCSDKSYYTPMSEVPSRRMFDYALTWIPADSLFLDPGDAGGEVGALDEIFSERVMCRPMAQDSFISVTPKLEKNSGVMTSVKLALTENGSATGTAALIYYNQAAIEARRLFRKEGIADSKTALDHQLFREGKKGVKSFAVAPDSLQSPGVFNVSCDLELSDFFDPDEPDFELAIYPGPTFDTTTIDYNPPRKYPIYLRTISRNVYTVEWNLGSLYHPTDVAGLNQSVDMGLLTYKLLAEYDSTQGLLNIRRQDNRSRKLFDPQFSSSFEKYLKNAKKCDLSTISVVKE
jgi:hypothetical protein